MGYCVDRLNINANISQSRDKRKEKNLWQRSFWEHLIRDKEDYAQHGDYIHYNPVKDGLCSKAQEWEYSNIHRFIAEGMYPTDWAITETIIKPQGIWNK
ncbi:MAG: hypothetical protein HC799_18455 [Limnothrix sp. RL_2_0]|nr:hypothetical protein [Limnothrix sp. RL_2_0]